MANPSKLNEIIQRILNENQNDDDVEALRQWLNSGGSQNLQVGKYNINIGQGQDIYIGDRTYQGLDAEAIREVARAVIQGSNTGDIREIVRSILKQEFQNLAQRENPQSSSHKTILVLASSPTNEARLRLDKEVREIDEGLRRSQQREKFTLQQRWAVRPDDLRRALLDFNPEIIHFCGHGSGDDGLVLQDDAGKAQLVPTEALVNLFKLQELAITPILLSLTCAVFHQTGKFYSKRSKLYEEGLELLLVQWDKSRSVERDEIYRDLSVERKLELLSYVAVKKFKQQQYVLFEQEELEGYIGEFLGIEQRESRGVLQAIASQHGLLIERSHKVWSFSHLTFQEYLVAKWFYSLEDWEELVSHITDKHWREVFFLLSGITKNADTLLLRMKQQVDLIMASDSKLQKLLEWIHDKSISINQRAKFNPYAKFSEIIIGDGKYIKGYYFLDNLNVYNLTATRAFYIDISIAFYIDNDINCQCIRVRSLARALDINFNYDLDNCFIL